MVNAEPVDAHKKDCAKMHRCDKLTAVKTTRIGNLIQENKTLFIIIIVGLFLLELEIFALAAMKSGRQSWLQVIDANGNVIHETSGKNLSEFNKYYFEKTFGPFENYQVRLETREHPFPFRAWFVAAIGIPVGAMLLFGFVVKAYVAIFHGNELQGDETTAASEPGYESRLESILVRISRMNIFIIGFLIFVGVISYWIIPNMITYIGRTGIDAIIRFQMGVHHAGGRAGGHWRLDCLSSLSAGQKEHRKPHGNRKAPAGAGISVPTRLPLQLEASSAENDPRASLEWNRSD